jgi:catechol 2,3-dioxygenase
MGTQAKTISSTSIDPRTRVGQLSLTVADLGRSIDFYTKGFGLRVQARGGNTASLGAGDSPLLQLVEERGARPWPGRYTGLYHFAVLVPTRADLGRWLRHWLESGYPLPGQGDHLVSEALYLSDPDGNGIEIYRDRPRNEWTWANGQVRVATDPVDIEGVIAEGDAVAEPWIGLPHGTRLGHMHIQVGDIDQAAAFYNGVLGFDVVARIPNALFVSAGGYHHHIGMNTWHSRGATAAPAGVAGLRHFTVELADEAARVAVVERLQAAGQNISEEDGDVIVPDPWHNIIRLRVSPRSS